MHAEDAYLFRHALLRDAAYGMQLPSIKASLHRLCALLIKDLIQQDEIRDAFPEVADHLRQARQLEPSNERFPEELAAATAAANFCLSRFDLPRAARYWQQASEVTEGPEVSALTSKAASLYFKIGQYDRARALFESVLKDEHLIKQARIETTLNLGAIDEASGNIIEAEASYRTGLDAARLAGLAVCADTAATSLAKILWRTGRFQEATDILNEVIESIRERGDLEHLAVALGNLAGINATQGRTDEARALCLKALLLRRETKDRRGEGVELSNLALLAFNSGNLEEAVSLTKQALEASSEVGNRHSVGLLTGNLASFYRQAGRLMDAEPLFVEALGIQRELGNARSEGVVLGNYARLLVQLQRTKEAEDKFREALQIHSRVGNVRHRGIHRGAFAILQFRIGSVGAAVDNWTEAMKDLSRVEDRVSVKDLRAEMREACVNAGIAPFEVPEIPEEE